ncbi:hypothetical protein ACFQL1_04020 [Halomicroarcula sp. GCM10025709]|uniref:hypothetical protein n=1 Tax=Haloarcula TaxID=2237 RepID=UPI0024C2FAB2|nr:hypothetical protein [Halomicroarcula sp. YJ-61-S]
MARTSDPKLHVVAAVAVGLGLVQAASGAVSLLFGLGSLPTTLLALAQGVAGLVLVPAGVGIALRKGWGRTLGIVAFGGVAVLQLTPLIGGATVGVPLVGLAVSVGSSLYLLLASEAFADAEDTRPLSKDESAHEFVR